jgi:hypothetical protein
MRSIMDGGGMVLTGSGKKTFKAQTQSGMASVTGAWEFRPRGEVIPWEKIEALKDVQAFSEHRKAVEAMGFSLFVKRAKIGQNKHIRVRPLFHAGWQAFGQIDVWDEQLTKDVLTRIINLAGRNKGLGDWRPGSGTPGSYGMYEAVVS